MTEEWKALEAENARLTGLCEKAVAGSLAMEGRMGWTVEDNAKKAVALADLQARVGELERALGLTDAHLRLPHIEVVSWARSICVDVPHDLWPEGDLDSGRVNAWVKSVRRAALGVKS